MKESDGHKYFLSSIVFLTSLNVIDKLVCGEASQLYMYLEMFKSV